MKRILFFVVIAATMMSCKKGEVTTETACIDLADYDTITDVYRKADWLKKNGKYVCQDTLNNSSERDHFVVDASVFTPTSGRTLTINWGDIKTLMKDDIYENYITFEIDSLDNINKITTTERYTKNPFCFSMPLFRGIDKKMTLDDSSEFLFTSANLGTTPAIFFKITKDLSRPNSDFAYYDFSDEPKKTSDGNLSNKKSPL